MGTWIFERVGGGTMWLARVIIRQNSICSFLLFLLLFFQTFCHSETSDVRWLRLWKIVFYPVSILFFLVFSPCFLSYPATPHDPQYNNNNNNIITRSRLHPVFSVRSLPVCCRNLMICYDIILITIITITIYTYLPA